MTPAPLSFGVVHLAVETLGSCDLSFEVIAVGGIHHLTSDKVNSHVTILKHFTYFLSVGLLPSF
jgi:hypothetical protein